MILKINFLGGFLIVFLCFGMILFLLSNVLRSYEQKGNKRIVSIIIIGALIVSFMILKWIYDIDSAPVKI